MKFIKQIMAISFLAIFLSACGGSNPVETNVTNKAPDPQGKFGMVLTDAEGDFVSYTVDVSSIELTRPNGTVVETVPVNARINFADYTDLSEFFSVVSVPEGIYNKVSLNLDYSNAEIIIQDDQGNTYPASPVDSAGNPISQFSMDIELGDNDAVRITNGKIAFLTIDFDLAASNTILGFNPAQVQVEPFLVATADLVDSRDHRARGLLNNVDLDNNLITLDIRPFHIRNGDFGQISAQANDQTHYEINGEEFTGSDGLNQLATLTKGEPVIIQGQIFTAERTFVAAEVFAGTSVPWDNMDAVRGVVVARIGDRLTVVGAHASIGGDSVTYRDRIFVDLTDTTRISQQRGSDRALTKMDISVGTRLIATGSFDPATSVLDTSNGFARMGINSVKGQVNQTSPLEMQLTRINGRPVRIFDFSGTGQDPSMDVDPAHFEIDTSTLTLNSINAGDWLKVRGFFNAFGAAPSDYFAKSIIDIATDKRAAGFAAGWENGTADAITEFNPNSLVFNTSGATKAFVKIAGLPVINVVSDTPFVVTSVDSDRAVYAIKHIGLDAIRVYHNFADFSQALQDELDNGLLILRTSALGRYDQNGNEFTAVAFSVLFN